MESLLVLYNEHVSQHHPIIHVLSGIQTPHPENSRRFLCLLNAAKESSSNTELKAVSREATLEELTRVHNSSMVHFILNSWDSFKPFVVDGKSEIVPEIFSNMTKYNRNSSTLLYRQSGIFCFDTSTPIGSNTAKIARESAALAIDAAKEMLNGNKYVYALCRPPGHHATADHYGGYCYFNNVALAADHLAKSGEKRVVILDVDYHHGNGTQDIFYERDDVYYLSIHADPSFEYPYFTGTAEEIGEGKGKGFNKNFPLPAGSDWKEYKPAFDASLEIIRQFKPDYLLVSLGLDAADKDPICVFHLKPEDFFAIGAEVRKIGVQTLVVQEGGYSDNEVLGACAKSFFKGLTNNK